MLKLAVILLLTDAVLGGSTDLPSGMTEDLKTNTSKSRTKRQLTNMPALFIIRQVQEYYPDGSYYFAFQTANGIKVEERGRMIRHGAGAPTKTVQGSYGYTSPEGVPVSVNYNADRNGYRPMTRLGSVGAGGASRPRMNTQQ